MSGWVVSGFEDVQRCFDAGLSAFGRGGGAYCIYLEGRKAVDLWAGEARPGVAWTEHTPAVMFSTTKGAATVCVAILAHRGHLDVDAPVAAYWPEFAANGKEGVLVAHVLSHTSGVISLPDHGSVLAPDGAGWDRYDEIAERLAMSSPAWPPGSRMGYHAFTFGWLVGELVRRIDGRSLGRFFDDEVAQPLGLDMWIGTPPDKQELLARPIAADAAGHGLHAAQMSEAADPHTLLGQAGLATGSTSALEQLDRLGAEPAWLRAEQPGANGTGTARSIAKLYALVGAGGELDGVRLLSPEVVARFSTPCISGIDSVIGVPFTRGLGFHLNQTAPGTPGMWGPTKDAFGHAGAGGQAGWCDPARGVAGGFLRNHMALMPAPLLAQLNETLYSCLG